MEQSNQDRLLLLQRMLSEETDECHQFAVQELVERLRLYLPDMKLDPRTIRNDLDTLQANGFEITKDKGKFGKILYSYQSRLFETYQLRLLVDAVLSIKFMNEKEKRTMIQKLKTLTSRSIAKTLPEPNVYNPTIHIDYELVQNTVDKIHQAISKHEVLRYRYGRYNLDKKFEYSRNGASYEVEPYALIWKKDYYYLIGKFIETGELRHYRIDRIREIEIVPRRFKKEPFELQAYIDKSFNMYSGEEINIEISFDASLLNVVIDRFGLDADIQKMNEATFIFKGRAKMSEGLLNWILTWGAKAKVLSPTFLVDEMREKIEEMHQIYNQNIEI